MGPTACITTTDSLVIYERKIMLKNIIDLLAVDDFYGVSPQVDIAKGRYEFPTSVSSTIKHIKRVWHGSRNS